MKDHEDGMREQLEIDVSAPDGGVAAVREFMGDAVAQLTDDEIRDSLRGQGKLTYTLTRWKRLPSVAFRKPR